MADTIRVLGQLSPAADSESALYTVPAGYSAIISSLFVCNRSSSGTTFRVAVDVGGTGTTEKDHIYFDLPIAAKDTFIATAGISLASGDVIRVHAMNGGLSFNLFGMERG